MQERGDDVLIAVCNGFQARCLAELNEISAPRGQRCLTCTWRTDERWKEWTNKRIPLEPLDAWLPPDTQLGLDAEVAALADDQLPDFLWRGWPVGTWATLGLQLEWFGESWRDMPDWSDRLRHWLRATLAAGVAAGALFDEFQPDVVLLLDGAMPAERAVWQAAKEHGCRTVLYEGGQVPGSWILRDATAASAYDYSPEWEHWRDVPLAAAERHRLSVYLHQRQRREAPDGTAFSPPATGEVAALRSRLDLPVERKILVAFTSVTADAPSLYAAGAFGSQLAWLDACVALATAHHDAILVIRIHPAEGMFRVARHGAIQGLPEPMAEALAARWPVLPDNVRLVQADDPVSSYDLLDVADLVLVYISTLALEAAAMGRPAIVAGRSHYAGRGIVPSPATAADLPRLVEALLVQRHVAVEAQELAWRYLYLWFFRADVQLQAVTTKPWGDRLILVPGDEPNEDVVLERMVGYIRGEGPFLEPPPAWRPRDAGPARALVFPEGQRILLVPDGLEASELAREVFGPAAADRCEVIVVTTGIGWSVAVTLCETACRLLGGPDTWPAVRLLPIDVPDADWVAWMMQVKALVVSDPTTPLAKLAADLGALCLVTPATMSAP